MTAAQVEAVTVEALPEAAVLHIHADIDATVAPCLRQVLADAIDRYAHVVVDLADVPTLGPEGLAVLVRGHRRARRLNGWVCLAAPSRFVVTVLHTMRVDGVFPIFDDCASALDWLGAPAGSTLQVAQDG
jgi:anti-sigma B factor antagonist